jgi:hypothetical protein
MRRSLLTLLLGAAAYGFAIGSAHSFRQGEWNLLKFPLLLVATCLLCAPAYYLLAQFIARGLSFGAVLRLVFRAFADASLLLASLAPACFFLAQTITPPDSQGLNEYPMFLGLNVAFIALCGTAAVVRQAGRLLKSHTLSPARSAMIVVVWLGVSLFVGGQCAWYMRPFFGVRTSRPLPFMEGSNPNSRGARSFYEAVYHIVNPPPLPKDYLNHENKD